MMNSRHLGIVVGLVVSAIAVVGGDRTLAQSSDIVPDNTLGAENSVVTPVDAATARVEGGAIRGNNLFHSFQKFNIGDGNSVYFANPASVTNIFSRVTGNDPSNILGKLGVSGDANLFFMNPNGIVFGEKASLDLKGSFVATTANAIRLGETGVFSASEPQTSNLLTVNPSALLFNAVAAQPQIINQSRVFGLNGETNIIDGPAGLQVAVGKTIALIGGDVTLQDGNLTAAGGRIELGSMAGVGKVGLSQTENGLVLDYSLTDSFGEIRLDNTSVVDVTAGEGGNIAVTAQSINILGESSLQAGIRSGLGSVDSQVGDIILNATKSITVANNSSIYNFVDENAVGSGGNIIIETARFVQDNATIAAYSDGEGHAGDIFIQAEESVEVINGSFLTDLVLSDGTGNAGNLTITTESLSLRDGASITNETRGIGDAGNLTIETTGLISDNSNISINVRGKGIGRKAGDLIVRASNSVELSGEILTPEGEIFSPGGLLNQVDLGGEGQGGNLTVETVRLSVSNGSKVQVATHGQGSPGELLIRSSEVEVFNTPDANNRFVTGMFAGILQDPRSQELPVGKGSKLKIETERLSIRGGGRVSGETLGVGDGGDLVIQAEDLVEVVGTGKFGSPSFLGSQVKPPGPITPVSPEAITGSGGNLIITTRQLSVREGGEVSVSTFARGNAGNIFVQASDLVEVVGKSSDETRSSLSANVNEGAAGKGGELTIETQRLSVRDGGQVSSASNAAISDGGSITVEANALEVVNGGRLLTTTQGNGRAGDITLKIAGKINLRGSDSGLFANTTPGSTGKGGNIFIPAPVQLDIPKQLTITDGARIAVNSEGAGDGGSLQIRADNITLERGGFLSATTASGQGGNITLGVKDLLLMRRNSEISARAGSIGNGGNIDLNTKFLVAFPEENSDITADAFEGTGGNINIQATGIFGIQSRNPLTSLSDFNASSEFGVDGVVDINTPDVDLQNSLTELAANFANPDQVVAGSCLARRNVERGSFTVTGTGGLPHSPYGAIGGRYKVTEVQPLQGSSGNLSNQTVQVERLKPWKLGDPIQEAQGMIVTADGRTIIGTNLRLAAATHAHDLICQQE